MKPIYGLTHIAKLEAAIKEGEVPNVISTEQYNNKGIFSMVVEIDTTQSPVDFVSLNLRVKSHQCHIVQVAAREPSIVAFFIDQNQN